MYFLRISFEITKFLFILFYLDGVAKVMSVVDTSLPAWYTYYPRPVAAIAHPRDASSMREKHSSPRKMVAMPTVVPCMSPKQGSVYPTNHHHHHHQQQHHRHRDDDGDSADDNMMPFDLSRNGGSSPSSSPRSPLRSQRMSPAAFKPYDGGTAVNNDQPLDLRVDHKKSRRGDELEDENQNLIIRTPSPEDIEVDSPGPPSVQYPLPPHHNHNRGIVVHSPCSSDKDVVVTDDHHHHHHHSNNNNNNNNSHNHNHNHHRRGGITVDDERHHRMVNYPVLFPPQPLHPMMFEAMYRASGGGGGDKSRLPPSLAGYQPGGGFHRPSQHYPFINSPLLNGHHHVPPPTYDVVQRTAPPPPVARSPLQKSSPFQETSGKPKDR